MSAIDLKQAKKYWQEKTKGIKHKDAERKAGFYLNLHRIGHNPYDTIWNPKMESGETGIYELIEYEKYDDPDDMIKSSYWNAIGYVGKKTMAECTFEEYLDIYVYKKK
ncbi:hypothetical protein V9L05_01410 [Bernardetia sp. Wsw4-3y2]|uniref:hypothetical protein n=1 Tax=Bernardetia sp. Wsw4-3y2 TaxID=3127471 RepID=UPI0030D3ADD7